MSSTPTASKKKVCAAPGCGRNAAYGRTLCIKCAVRKWRAENPMRASYMNLRSNAKRRGKIFTITFEYFTQFAIETDYITGRGKTKDSFTVDCIENDLGYVPGNIRSIPLIDNARKGVKKLEYDWRTNTAVVVPIHSPHGATAEDNPF